MDGGDGLLSQIYPFTLDGHTIMVITSIALTPTIVVGITGKERYSRAAGVKPL
jgi:hypothetical protein